MNAKTIWRVMGDKKDTTDAFPFGRSPNFRSKGVLNWIGIVILFGYKKPLKTFVDASVGYKA
ncbi:hypothetical protein [Sphingobacterium hotanense]|uniref:hypothetical protein n=1 Tax=Sphingobacterium hotanense TaxID=649196 RepID=UPI0021A54EED|nr:hypothetical protein [Sphingobacterium hotanense]MCT1526968.1 hypothetical protein [Sphingobacterium hotanense]